MLPPAQPTTDGDLNSDTPVDDVESLVLVMGAEPINTL